MFKKTSVPKLYWVYFTLMVLCIILLPVNFIRTDSWTGDKPFSAFEQRDWLLLAIFLTEELLLMGLAGLFGFLSARTLRKQDTDLAAQWELARTEGVDTAEFDYVWVNFEGTERALILVQKETYRLYMETYEQDTGMWRNISSIGVFSSLLAVQKALYYDCNFYCEANAARDSQGDFGFRNI